MKYGFTMPGRGPLATPERLGIVARKGEEFGFDALLTGDHILVPKNISSPYPYTEGGEFPGSSSGESMEQITLLSYIAGQTSKIRLVTSVLIVPHRNPLIAAKSLATLDVLSGGRLVVGVGVGWMREEFEALGLPPFEERGAVTDEYIRAFKVLWTEDDPHFEGKYISFDDITFLPKPVQKPHPPIWVGGESRPALRRTAELADGWYPLGSNPTFPMGTPDELKAGLDRLAQYAQRFDRDPKTIETIYRTHQFELTKDAGGADRLPFVGDADQIAGDIRRYQDMGVTTMIWDFLRQTDDLDQMLGLMEDFSNQVWPRV
ncbi:MAG TPA: LLM class F420-dependent oxidoreductase [Dehalococcoidia bacterium]|jgi:probable F420-dependent oxidoreductase|nr:LLM class F420-dependent oxidoreductase [Dehalococcoidia bacterium]HIL30398.1 LLM class F420-dependent oxidoreductase [Dehalococcoidia bacterium]